ncbi:hypothetical protein BU24DRAFT_412501 [Aaosphaeria arxii CBS 175.79]|uniref:Ig-like domain-containing protein n=1 Tax=Aaosphaeria arxii CBS 175.79 TaxID=1450172 RepID=A0A6A5XGH3_9PLEO|nr:uncharacterized protein BU24DRAFT_412501 [Aaosphaeria arxii CBS 175.79]KAF2011956.1 hypothetical protein BU24DRAFT_412501 [Aaosphaeria arxii CBS 175.79]
MPSVKSLAFGALIAAYAAPYAAADCFDIKGTLQELWVTGAPDEVPDSGSWQVLNSEGVEVCTVNGTYSSNTVECVNATSADSEFVPFVEWSWGYERGANVTYCPEADNSTCVRKEFLYRQEGYECLKRPDLCEAIKAESPPCSALECKAESKDVCSEEKESA